MVMGIEIHCDCVVIKDIESFPTAQRTVLKGKKNRLVLFYREFIVEFTKSSTVIETIVIFRKSVGLLTIKYGPNF
jgi:uncharacterized protein YlzI (FlbEa/FlbD family)